MKQKVSMRTGPETAIPEDTHEWVSFEDPDEERTWTFDATFLLSRWTCIFGAGCQGVLTGPTPEMVQGCCSYGAHFTDDEDRDRVEALVEHLTAEEWQYRDRGLKRGTIRVNKHGETVTRLADDACIFLNRPDFAAGAGCALHLAALNRGERPLDWKPNVCWQLPLRRDDVDDDDGHVTSRVAQWDRKHWGEGGQEFHWWCTEGPEAFVGQVPVYESLREELVEMVGLHIYDRLRAYLDSRRRTQPLPHPAVRTRTPTPSSNGSG